jgi:hypothetical protein
MDSLRAKRWEKTLDFQTDPLRANGWEKSLD